jgi:lysophospholipase L1-like esterase
MLYNQYQAAAEPVETGEPEDDEEAPLPPSVWEPVEVEPPPARVEADLQKPAAPLPQKPEDREWDLVESQAFLDEIFRGSESRNEALKTGQVSDSVLDDDEDEAASADTERDESILSNQLGNESIIFSGQDEESRILSMADVEDLPAEELPGSNTPEDRKPHFPAWYVPNFKTVKRLLDGEKPVTWMFAGESSASAADLTQGRRSFTDHFSERLRTELGRMLDVIINTSNTGETAKGLLKNLEWRVLRFHPEVVSILLGRKDSERGPEGREDFQGCLEQIVQIVREAGAVLVLHTPNRIDVARAGHLADLRNYVRIIRSVAKAFNIPLVDHWEDWKQQKPDSESLKTWLAADGVLPGVYGHREMAKLIFQRFEIFDPNSPICSARVP